jgi:hypothetical protein
MRSDKLVTGLRLSKRNVLFKGFDRIGPVDVVVVGVVDLLCVLSALAQGKSFGRVDYHEVRLRLRHSGSGAEVG